MPLTSTARCARCTADCVTSCSPCRSLLAGGRLLRFGRPLVKDVAGYQMSKLFCGSFGSLGVLTEVTLKIVSRPLARRTFAVVFADLGQAALAGLAALRLATICSGVVVVSGEVANPSAPGCSLLVTLEGHPADVTAEIQAMHRALAGLGEVTLLEDEATSAAQAWAERLAGSRFAPAQRFQPAGYRRC